MRVFCFPPHTRERNIPSSVWWLIPRGNGGEKEQRRETSVGKECSLTRALSLSSLSLSLSLSFLALKRAFLSSKVALSENLSQIHQNCGREGNETRLREKDFEREHAEPKKKNKREEREREKQKQRAKTKREESFFFFFRSLLSLFVFSLFSLLLCFFRFFFSRDESLLRSSNIQTHHSFRTRSLFLVHHTFLSLKVSLSVSLSLSVSSFRRTNFSVWDF